MRGHHEQAARRVRRAASSALLAPVLGALLFAYPIAAQSLPESEGPLNNDVFLPTSRQAGEALESGDTSLRASASEQDRLLAYEAWRSALTATQTGDSVERTERDTLGVELAVRRRLLALAPDRRIEWTRRFEDLARAELVAAGRDERRLAEVARRNPGTTAATEAALRLADLELERGASLAAIEWCRRASADVELAAPALTPDRLQRLRDALRVRDEVSSSLRVDATSASKPETWKRATELRLLSRIDYENSIFIPNPLGPPDPGPPSGIRPGLALLADGRLAIQSASRVSIVKADGQSIESSFEPSLLLPDAVAVGPALERRGDTTAWPLLPAVAGGDLVLVHGRPARPGRNNALLSLSPPRPQPTLGVQRPALPELNWAIVGKLRVDRQRRLHVVPELEALEDAAFGSGPLVVGNRVLATLREGESEVRAWLACFDLATGECLWTRLLAKGSAFQPGSPGFGAPRLPIPSQPLAAQGGQVFVGTNLGAGFALDALDGRLVWGFKNRRRTAGSTSWRGNWRPSLSLGPELEPTVVWAPLDSDREYLLALEPREDPLVRAPRPIGEALALLGGDSEQSVVLSRAGSRRVLSSRRNRDGARFDSPFLGREESFRGAGALSPERVLFSSDRGLYLLDRTRELFLLDYQPYPSIQLPMGGEVHARGERVFVQSEASLWTFEAR